MHRKHGIILKAVITVCSAAFLVTGCGKADSLYDKGMDYIKDKDYKQALECFDDAIAVNNEKAEYYIASGMAYNYLGKYQDAIKRFSKACLLFVFDMLFSVIGKQHIKHEQQTAILW